MLFHQSHISTSIQTTPSHTTTPTAQATPSKSCAAILHSPVHVCPLDEVKVFAAKAPLRIVQYEVDDRGGQALLLPPPLGAGSSAGDLLEGMVGELHARLPAVAKTGNLDAEALRASHDNMGAWFGLRCVASASFALHVMSIPSEP